MARALRAVRRRASGSRGRSTSTTSWASRSSCSRGTPRCSRYYRELWRYVLVDEYQDTNRAQYRILRQLTAEHRNLCVVGDPDQSIYRFRGADLRNILDFERDFPGCRVVRLEQNYRSTGRILEIAAAVIAHNQARKDKSLWTENARGRPGAPLPGAGRDEEALWVARTTAELAGRRAVAATASRCSTGRTRSRACSRTPFARRGHSVPHRGRRALLRAEGGQGRPRLPPARHEPGRRPRVPARPRRAAARDRARHAGAPGGARGRRRRAAPRHRGARRRGAPRAGRVGRSATSRGWSGSSRRWPPLRGLSAQRVAAVIDGAGLPRGPPPGGHGRGRGPAGEPGGADRRRGGVRGAPGGRATSARFLDSIALIADVDELEDARRRRDAHDAPLGQGARVPGGVPDRARGGRVPPRPGARGRGGDRGGAAALLRRAHAGEGAALPVVRGGAPARRLRGPPRALALPPRDAGRRRRAGRRPARTPAPAGRRRGPAAWPSPVPIPAPTRPTTTRSASGPGSATPTGATAS